MQLIPETETSRSVEDRQPAVSEINLVFTNPETTRPALKQAIRLADGHEARIRIIVLRPVPFPCELDSPPVAVEYDRKRVTDFVSENVPGASVLMCYCRDEADALVRLFESSSSELRSASVVVIAGRKRRWFPSKAQVIARKLEDAGQQVVFVETRGNHA